MIKLEEAKYPFIVRCEQCNQTYVNHAGSTPCCGSITDEVARGIDALKDPQVQQVVEILKEQMALFGIRDGSVTNVLDSEGSPIVEGDLLYYPDGNDLHLYVVADNGHGLVILSIDEYNCDRWILYSAVADMQTTGWMNSTIIVGNIYDDPSLLNLEK